MRLLQAFKNLNMIFDDLLNPLKKCKALILKQYLLCYEDPFLTYHFCGIREYSITKNFKGSLYNIMIHVATLLELGCVPFFQESKQINKQIFLFRPLIISDEKSDEIKYKNKNLNNFFQGINSSRIIIQKEKQPFLDFSPIVASKQIFLINTPLFQN